MKFCNCDLFFHKLLFRLFCSHLTEKICLSTHEIILDRLTRIYNRYTNNSLTIDTRNYNRPTWNYFNISKLTKLNFVFHGIITDRRGIITGTLLNIFTTDTRNYNRPTRYYNRYSLKYFYDRYTEL